MPRTVEITITKTPNQFWVNSGDKLDAFLLTVSPEWVEKLWALMCIMEKPYQGVCSQTCKQRFEVSFLEEIQNAVHKDTKAVQERMGAGTKAK